MLSDTNANHLKTWYVFELQGTMYVNAELYGIYII